MTGQEQHAYMPKNTKYQMLPLAILRDYETTRKDDSR